MNMKHMLQDLIDYNYSEHRALWQYIIALDENVFLQDSGYSIGSLQRETVHIIRADRLWFSRATGLDDPQLLPYETTSRDEIRTAWDSLENDIRAYLDGVEESVLQETMTYTAATGETITRERWQLLMHLVNHGSVHRAEICAIFHMLGHTLDFEVTFRGFLEARDLKNAKSG